MAHTIGPGWTHQIWKAQRGVFVDIENGGDKTESHGEEDCPAWSIIGFICEARTLTWGVVEGLICEHLLADLVYTPVGPRVPCWDL